MALICGICFDPVLENASVTGCGHIFHAECVNMQRSVVEEQNKATGSLQFGYKTAKCLMCQQWIKRNQTSKVFPMAVFLNYSPEVPSNQNNKENERLRTCMRELEDITKKQWEEIELNKSKSVKSFTNALRGISYMHRVVAVGFREERNFAERVGQKN